MAYQNILVPIDGSETALAVIQHAVDVAKAFQSKVTVIQVMTLDPYLAVDYLALGQSNQYIERAKTSISSNLETAKQKFAEQGVEVEIKVLEGENIAETIADFANQLDQGLVILSSHGRSGIKKLILGSVAQSLISLLKVPFLVVKQ
ncbi:universal stress protein [Acinetobacter larvae]|uniref:Universal stress protein n=1 Tax=Acinetobacter larvae TaxID=1789224 RepID=A0A1B2LXR3_9GAMM|nr:universal stress protein [Acinetobacter larvae]AOA57726.1 universal stress protein [Acinetobacter larvae]